MQPQAQLKSLKIDRSQRGAGGGNRSRKIWIVGAILLAVLLGWGGVQMATAPAAVEIVKVPQVSGASDGVVLNATGYVVAAHKIQVASKVVGRVAAILVEKGDKVREGQVLVRLEDDEYRAQLQQAKGRLAALEAKLDELNTGSRPEEIERARADVEEAEADLANAKIVYNRVEPLVRDGVQARSVLDDARARLDRETARVNSLKKAFELVRIGPRREQIAAVRGQIQEVRGEVAFYETQLSNTVIKAPVSGTILERAVEKGEFVTTSFVGDRGAKGYVASLADLNDLRVELDISQNDFAKLHAKQRATLNTDAFPDRKYEGVIEEIAPEANRQKATVQVKVRVLQPDEYLRPEMNATVAFLDDRAPSRPAAKARPSVPPAAMQGDSVFVVAADGKVAKRAASALAGGEDVVLNPPAGLKDGDKVVRK